MDFTRSYFSPDRYSAKKMAKPVNFICLAPEAKEVFIKRVVAVWKVIVDLNGTFRGTAYLGGFHGFYAMHGMSGDCGCIVFEEHQHYITNTTPMIRPKMIRANMLSFSQLSAFFMKIERFCSTTFSSKYSSAHF